MKLIGTLGALALLGAAPIFVPQAAAQDQSDEEAAKHIITDPNPGTFTVYGVTPAPKSVKDETVQGGRALLVKTTGSGDPWGVGVNVPIIKPVKAGDTLQLMFFAKLAKAEPGVTSARIASGQVQLAAAPYTSLFGKEFQVGPEWQLYQVTGKADRDYAAGALNAAFHLNTGKHTVALGIVVVMNKGQ